MHPAAVEEEERDLPTQRVLVVHVGQALRLAQRRRGRLPPAHCEGECGHRHGERTDVLLFFWHLVCW
jgi:hypothetical protein